MRLLGRRRRILLRMHRKIVVLIIVHARDSTEKGTRGFVPPAAATVKGTGAAVLLLLLLLLITVGVHCRIALLLTIHTGTFSRCATLMEGSVRFSFTSHKRLPARPSRHDDDLVADVSVRFNFFGWSPLDPELSRSLARSLWKLAAQTREKQYALEAAKGKRSSDAPPSRPLFSVLLLCFAFCVRSYFSSSRIWFLGAGVRADMSDSLEVTALLD